MPIESRLLDELNELDTYMTTDNIATLLVKLYADYSNDYGENNDYAKAVAIAIRMLTD